MANERTTEDLGTSRSDDAAVIREFADNLAAFAADIRTAGDALDRLEASTRERVLREIYQRLRTFGDLGHDAARALIPMMKGPL